VDAVITDPPYGISVHKNQTGGRGDCPTGFAWDERTPASEYFEQIKRVSRQQIVWGANYLNCFAGGGGAIVWDKLQPLPDASQCEIASCSKYKKVFKYTQRWTNFVNTKETKHPTEKPVALFEWIMDRFTKAGMTVLDPFMGSGTTGVACVNTGRNFIGVEIDAGYFKIAERRIRGPSQAIGTAHRLVIAPPFITN
jgi:tRNA G10  N-methylase Trm11